MSDSEIQAPLMVLDNVTDQQELIDELQHTDDLLGEEAPFWINTMGTFRFQHRWLIVTLWKWNEGACY